MDKEYQRVIDEAKEYVKLRYDMLRLELLEKSSRIIALIVTVVATLTLALAALTYFAIAAAYWLKAYTGSLPLSFCIIGGVFILLFVIVILLRKQLVINPIVKALSSILFKRDSEDYQHKIKE